MIQELWNIVRGRSTVYSTTGIVFLTISGLLFLIWPKAAMSIVCRLLGILLLIYGITLLLRFLKDRQSSFRTGLLILSILLIIVGALILGNPLSLIRISGTLLALFFLGYGIYSLVRQFLSGASRTGRWWFLTGGAAVELVLGILLLAAPVGMSAMVLRFLGIMMLYAAFSAISNRRRAQTRGEAFREEEKDPISYFRDTVGRYTGKNTNGKDIIEGTARDVTDNTDEQK